MAEVPLPSGGTQSAFLPVKIGQCKNGHGANSLTEIDIAHSHIVSRMVWSLWLAPSVWHRWDFDEQLHSTFPETTPWEPVASRTSIGWVGLVGLVREQSFTFDCGSIPGRNIVSDTLVFPCSSIWLCRGQQQVYHTSTFIARLRMHHIDRIKLYCGTSMTCKKKTNDRTMHLQSHSYGSIRASQHHWPFLRNLGRTACRQPRQSVQLLPKDVERTCSYGDCCEMHRGVLSNDQFHGGMLIGIILIWRHFPWMLPLVSEKLWDTKRWAFLSGRNRTIRPWNRKESVRCMRELKAFKDLKELVRVFHIFSCKWVRIQCLSHVRNHCLAFYTKFSKVKYIIPMLISFQFLLQMRSINTSCQCRGRRIRTFAWVPDPWTCERPSTEVMKVLSLLGNMFSQNQE